MSKRTSFSRQLAMWLYQVDWHYRTLLAVAIECVDNLPDDCDTLINELLLRYPIKPAETDIATYLLQSTRLQNWFSGCSLPPKINRFSLHSPAHSAHASAGHPAIDTLGDLADWLAITPAQLQWYANLWRYEPATPAMFQHYQYEFLQKRDGRTRLIEKPKTQLKRIQRRIYKEILSTVEIHPAAHGFCKNKNCFSHAAIHTQKHYLLLYDIADCFHSIGWPQVKAVFKRMGYPESVSVYLTALCTHTVRLKPAQRHLFDPSQLARLTQRHLPQGAPSSPALANATLHRLDKRLSGLAKHFNLDYSRYADDIALSGNHHRDWRFLEPLIGGICLDEGITLNYRKTRLRKPHQKQRVVGIVVNRKANIDRRYFDTLKAVLTNCVRHGLESQNRHDHPHFRAQLLGQVTHVKSLNEQRGMKLEKLFNDIQ